MRWPEHLLTGGAWASVVLVQVTLVALLGCLAWLVARRRGPSLRAAILLAALVALVLAPAATLIVPVWLPLPRWAGPADDESLPVVNDTGAPLASPPETAAITLLVAEPAVPSPVETQDPALKLMEKAEKPAKTEAIVLHLAPPAEETTPALPPVRKQRPAFPLNSMLALLWAVGAAVCLVRSLVRLLLLYRCSRQARTIQDPELTDRVESLAQRHQMSAIALREHPAIASPLTLGIFRAVILLSRGWRRWSSQQRTLILSHEMAHIQRWDFLTGLAAELAVCLCWFHPLVRWLASRFRLEQEYAADAWAASAIGDARDYVQCLARLALELDRGTRRPLAPAFWRRRPEILRRIEMLRRNPEGRPGRLGKRASGTLVLLTVAACLTAGGVRPLHSADSKAVDTSTETNARATADQQGDALPGGVRARLGTTRLRHGGEINFVAFGPKGKTLITAGHDNTIRLWDRASGKEIRRFAVPKPSEGKPAWGKPGEKARQRSVMQLMGGNDSGGLRVAVTADGVTLAVGHGNAIQLYKVETGEALRRIEGEAGGFSGLLFSPDGRVLAARAADDTLFVWAADSGKELLRIKPPQRPQSDGFKFILGGSAAGARGMAFTPDGKVLVAVGTDYQDREPVHSLKLWDVATGKEVRRIKTPPNVSIIAVAPDGQSLAYSSGPVIHLCEVKTSKELRQITTNAGRIVALAFTPDGKTLAVRSRNQQAGLWDTHSGKEVHHLSDAQVAPRTGGGLVLFISDAASPQTRTLALSADGKQVLAAAGSTVRVWETATGKELPLSDGHRQAPSMLVLSQDGKTVISWGSDRVVRRWQAATGKPLSAFPAPAGTTRAALSRDGRTVALVNADGTIRLHDAATGKELRRLKSHANGIAALAFSVDGKRLASRGSADNSVRLYDVAEGRELRQIALRPQRDSRQGTVLILDGGGDGAAAAGLAFSPDGGLLVTPGADGNRRNSLVILDTATGKELRKIELSQPIRSLAFSPDGRTLASENADRSLTLWEVASGSRRADLGKPAGEQKPLNDTTMELEVLVDGLELGNIQEPAGPIGLTFSPDGRVLAARGPDRTVRIWDVIAGKEIGQLQGHSGRIATVAFAPDGKTLASGATDTTILVWDANKPLRQVAKVQPIELSAAELETLWRDLAGEDAVKAHQAVLKMAASRQSVHFLNERLKPATRIDPRKIDGWIADLESEKYAVRREAAANLLKAGEQVVPALRKVLASTPTLETRQRVEELLQKLTGGTFSTEQLRLIRSVEALENIGTPEARQVLRKLSQGAPGALATREAEAALARSQKAVSSRQ